MKISISPDAESRLIEKARQVGVPPESLASKILEDQLSRPSVDDVLRPLRDQVAASGLSEEELGDLLERAKHEMRAKASQGRAA